MPIERTIYGIAIESGHVLNAAFKVKVDDDKDMLDLMKQIASEYSVPALHTVIWLVRLSLVVLPCLTSLYSQMSSFL